MNIIAASSGRWRTMQKHGRASKIALLSPRAGTNAGCRCATLEASRARIVDGMRVRGGERHEIEQTCVYDRWDLKDMAQQQGRKVSTAGEWVGLELAGRGRW